MHLSPQSKNLLVLGVHQTEKQEISKKNGDQWWRVLVFCVQKHTNSRSISLEVGQKSSVMSFLFSLSPPVFLFSFIHLFILFSYFLRPVQQYSVFLFDFFKDSLGWGDFVVILSAHDSERLWMLVCCFESDDAQLVGEWVCILFVCMQVLFSSSVPMLCWSQSCWEFRDKSVSK